MNITREKIYDYIKKIQGKKILIIGDVMIDAYKIGKVNRISPEAPVPVVFIEKDYMRLGGAANVALNIKSLGAEPILCSVVGNYKNSEIFKNLLDEKELTTEGIINDGERITTIKTRIISRGQQLLRIDEEIDKALSKETEEKLWLKIKELCNYNNIDVIIFEDYDKGVLSENLITKTIKLAKEKNIPTAVDPKIKNFNFYKEVNLFKPNIQEFINGFKHKNLNIDLSNIEVAAKLFLEQNLIENLMVTLSEDGIFISNKNNFYRFPAEKRDISDVSGAGDTVISVASLLLSINVPLDEIAYISNIAGGLVCEKIGVVPISVSDLLEDFK